VRYVNSKAPPGKLKNEFKERMNEKSALGDWAENESGG
jgi:hypothetical protein